MILSARILTSAAMLVIFAGMSIIALGYPEKARFLPLLIGVPGTLMSLAQLFFDVRNALRAGPAETLAEDRMETAREVRMFVWLGLFLVGIIGFGFLFAGPVLVAGFLRFNERESWLVSLAAGLGAWIILYAVFHWLLELYLFDGLLLPMLLR